MKRKFGFNLPPLKIPSKNENDALRAALDGNFEAYSPPTSPFIDRQLISIQQERQLKEACGALVRSAGSGSEPQSDSVFNLSNILKQRNAINKKDPIEKNQQYAELKPIPLFSEKKPKDSAAKVYVVVKDSEPQSAISDRRPNDSPVVAKQHDDLSKKATVFPVRGDSLKNKKHTHDRLAKNQVEPFPIFEELPVYDSGSDSPPRSSSTDRHPLSASTAMTSVAVTPLSKPTNQSLSQGPFDLKAYQNAIAKADNKALEWMTLQRQKPTDDVLIRSKSPTRTGTNESITGSLVSGIKNYIHGKSRSQSRSHSREPRNSTRPGSSAGQRSSSWTRGFSLRRQRSTSSLLDGKDEAPTLKNHKSSGDLKTPVDLNRKLPPLPGLDTYKGPEDEEVAVHVSPLSRSESSNIIAQPVLAKPMTAEIITVKPPSSKHKRTGSKTSAATPIPEEPPRKMSMQSSVDSCFTPAASHTPSRSMDVVTAAAKARSTENLRKNYTRKNSLPQNHTPRAAKSAGASRPTSRGSSKAPLPTKYSIIPHQRTPSQPVFYNRSAASSAVNLPTRPATRDASTPHYGSSRPSVSSPSIGRLPPNFSRKYPIDIDSESIPDVPDLNPANYAKKEEDTMVTEITALPPMPAKRPSGIRRVLSSLSVRRGKSFRDREVETWR